MRSGKPPSSIVSACVWRREKSRHEEIDAHAVIRPVGMSSQEEWCGIRRRREMHSRLRSAVESAGAFSGRQRCRDRSSVASPLACWTNEDSARQADSCTSPQASSARAEVLD